MADEKKQSISDIIKRWSTETLLITMIVGGILGYSELKAYVDTHTFSTPEIKALSEDFIKKNIGISGRENLEAQRDLTKKYQGLTNAIDTLSSIYKTSYESIDAYTKTNEAILEMVHDIDSLSVERLDILRSLIKENNIQSNATQLSLDKQSSILLINEKILQILQNPNTNFNGD